MFFAFTFFPLQTGLNQSVKIRGTTCCACTAS